MREISLLLWTTAAAEVGLLASWLLQQGAPPLEMDHIDLIDRAALVVSRIFRSAPGDRQRVVGASPIVRHIMVVRHYGCGGVSAAVDGRRRGLVHHWLHPLRELSRTHSEELDALPDERSRLDRLCELNVMQQVKERRLRRLRARRVGTRADSLSSWLGRPDQRFERDRERCGARLIGWSHGHGANADTVTAPDPISSSPP